MKKKLMVLCMIVLMLCGLCGCSYVTNIESCIKTPDSRIVDFELIENNFYGAILRDKNTDILYYWMTSSCGGITPIYNADGTLKLYENK